MDMKRFEFAGVAPYFRRMVGLAKLPGYKVRFTHIVHDGSRADIVEEDGVVEGKLYRLPLEAIEYLEEIRKHITSLPIAHKTS